MIVVSINGQDIWVAQNFTQEKKGCKKEAISTLILQLLESSEHILTPNLDIITQLSEILNK